MYLFTIRSVLKACGLVLLTACWPSDAAAAPLHESVVSSLTSRSHVDARGARNYSVLYAFGSESGDGEYPAGQLIADQNGNLFGTTSGGGAYGKGTVFELKLGRQGPVEQILYSFKGNADGGAPQGGLLAGPNGVLFGTTVWGGVRDHHCGGKPRGCGVVFELLPMRSRYEEKVLYTFNGPDGSTPYDTLAADASGALYGVAGGGTTRQGVVFKLTPSGSQYSESVIYAFQDRSDGGYPSSPVTLDAQGNIYGTTSSGGYVYDCFLEFGCGVIYKLTQNGSAYSESVLFDFGDIYLQDGLIPSGPLRIDTVGNIFGTAEEGGSNTCSDGCGTAFELSPNASGYSLALIHEFQMNGDAYYPVAGLTAAATGDLVGTGEEGGVAGYGAVFEFHAEGAGYAEKLLHSFAGGSDGAYPATTLLSIGKKLYGTTREGGNLACYGYGCGTIFELTP